MRIWCCLEVLEEAIHLANEIGLNCGIRRARENKVPRSQLVAGAWRAQVRRVNYPWRVFVIHVLKFYFLVDQFQLGGSRRGFSPSFLVSSSITHLSIILCLHLSSLLFNLYFFFFFFVLIMVKYGLG